MSGSLLRNALRFARLLRSLGAQSGPDRARLFCSALEHIQIAKRLDFYYTARACLIHRSADLEIFDRAFSVYWRRRWQGGIPLRIPRLRPTPRLSPPEEPPPMPDDSPAREPARLRGRIIYSPHQALRQKDFADLTPQELQEMQALMRQLDWRLGWRIGRRKRGGGGQQIDHRRSYRSSLRHGGEILLWARRQPMLKPRPLVVIADVSGSMERYTRLLLHFLYSLTQGLEQRVEAFVFSTQLTRISRQMQLRGVERALRQVSRRVPDWSGGTRIGAALRQFNLLWARRVLSGGAIVALMSDGLDRGEIELLRAEVARLQRSCHRLIWVNPLLGGEGYHPSARGMRAALPYVDDFLPAHNLASLEQLAERLFSASARRPLRPQDPWLRTRRAADPGLPGLDGPQVSEASAPAG